jgi:hypothetical protein
MTVEIWRASCRLDISVAAPFVWRCLSSPAVTPFPHPPGHRRGHPPPVPTERRVQISRTTLFGKVVYSTTSACSSR